MNKTFIIIILILLPFSSLATFDKKCNLKNISYISPSLGGCIFQITPSGQIIYIMNNNKVSDENGNNSQKWRFENNRLSPYSDLGQCVSLSVEQKNSLIQPIEIVE